MFSNLHRFWQIGNQSRTGRGPVGTMSRTSREPVGNQSGTSREPVGKIRAPLLGLLKNAGFASFLLFLVDFWHFPTGARIFPTGSRLVPSWFPTGSRPVPDLPKQCQNLPLDKWGQILAKIWPFFSGERWDEQLARKRQVSWRKPAGHHLHASPATSWKPSKMFITCSETQKMILSTKLIDFWHQKSCFPTPIFLFRAPASRCTKKGPDPPLYRVCTSREESCTNIPPPCTKTGQTF